jgi:uncharacterized protein YqjF (DUF2071 family)
MGKVWIRVGKIKKTWLISRFRTFLGEKHDLSKKKSVRHAPWPVLDKNFTTPTASPVKARKLKKQATGVFLLKISTFVNQTFREYENKYFKNS